MAKDTAGVRMNDESVAMRKKPTRRVNITFPVSLIQKVEQAVEGTGVVPAVYIREAVRQRLERES